MSASNGYSAESARIDATEARAKAEAYALENVSALLDYIYSEIREEAARGRNRCYIRLVPTEESQWFANAANKDVRYKPADRLSHVPSGVALEGHVLISVDGGVDMIQPTSAGKAVLKHLQSMGYEAAFGSYPNGALVVSWDGPRKHRGAGHEANR